MKKIFILLLVFAINNVCAAWLIWDQPGASVEQVVQYKIYRVRGNTADLIGTTTPPVTSFDLANFVQGSRSVFYVTAINVNGESLQSSKITVQKR
jgi:hypothetical protein